MDMIKATLLIAQQDCFCFEYFAIMDETLLQYLLTNPDFA